MLTLVTKRDHERGLGRWGTPTNHLVVVELGQRRRPRRHLRVLVELGLPTSCGHCGEPLRTPDHRHAISNDPGELPSWVVLAGHVGPESPDQLVQLRSRLLEVGRQRRQETRGLDRAEYGERDVTE